MARLLPDPPARLGLAVSGGADSTAMMALAAVWAKPRKVELFALSVDHGLREAAAKEVAQVARQAAAIGVAHSTLRWQGWDGKGNLQDAARRARQGMIHRWRGAIDHVLIGHTMDDQAETVLMRLGRGSGVEGLSGMAETNWIPAPAERVKVSEAEGTAPPQAEVETRGYWAVRPLLGLRRRALRDWLKAKGIPWSEDPTNNDAQYDRVRVRRLLSAGSVGLSVEGLAETAARMARAREALTKRAHSAAQAIARVEGPDVVLRRLGLVALDADTRLRLAAHALMWVSSADYRPREAALGQALDTVMGGQTTTLHGCLLHVESQGEDVRITREYKAVAPEFASPTPGLLWDNRWRLVHVPAEGLVLRALGEDGLAQIASTPENAPPRPARLALPSLWHGETLVAAPTLGHGAADCIVLDPVRGEFAQSLTAH